jgi:hypothetical protein
MGIYIIDTPTLASVVKKIDGNVAKIFCPHIHSEEVVLGLLREFTDSHKLPSTPSQDSTDHRLGLRVYPAEDTMEKYVIYADNHHLLGIGIPLTRAEGRFLIERVYNHSDYRPEFSSRDINTKIVYKLLQEAISAIPPRTPVRAA